MPRSYHPAALGSTAVFRARAYRRRAFFFAPPRAPRFGARFVFTVVLAFAARLAGAFRALRPFVAAATGRACRAS